MTQKPKPYHPHLTPTISHLQPHCLAKERLILWHPAHLPLHLTVLSPLPQSTVDRITSIIGASWTDSTKELYGTSLLVFHVFHDLNNIPDESRCPISSNTLTTFLVSSAGTHSSSTLANYAARIRAWHIVHGCSWDINEAEYKVILEGTTRLAPNTSKHPWRALFTVNILVVFHSLFDHNDPCNAAIFTCLVMSFYCIARLGEFTVPTIQSFKPAKHIT
ncbi:hypothetical protein M404DRAFT_169606 [Pisolithus tinctorius Marx 270]|uniref:Uncharacterized protein n=1 Tax=Pisolithus tinctorius Marx 270 TaxID=870435 RepID=A0A0C3MYJ6_PISTI|nr:hypothetical protein M404DRAFT_169606 [Pisolithus tinctorius Marx 270]